MDQDKAAQLREMLKDSEVSYDQLLAEFSEKLPELQKQDLSSQIFVVTGANTGIGYETTKAIAKMNPKKIIMACRNVERGIAALETIKKETNCNNIDVWPLDLNSFDSVKAFAKKYNDSGLPLDSLVSNAGFAMSEDEWSVNENGHETTIQVNHLGNALLVLLLTPALKKSASPRVNIVTSGAHFFAPADEKDPALVSTVLKKPDAGKPMSQYALSKLLNVLFVAEYAKRCPHNVWICSSNPGYSESSLGTKSQEGEKLRERKGDPLGLPMRTTEDGAKTIVYASVYPEVLSVPRGVYANNMRAVHPTKKTQNAEFTRNTWNNTMDILRPFVEHNSIEEWVWAK